ncbi:hypothetical protein V6N13_096381 [Hibiscus sabdariffa]|uniref:Uncharacterized protein n=1 Tax=Hibiscus sabdariffa TaxID=183260 RepID=A0ABR2DIS8_9ROSI
MGVKGGVSQSGISSQGMNAGDPVTPFFPLATLMTRINPASNSSGQDSRKSVCYSPLSLPTDKSNARLPLVPPSLHDVNMTTVGEHNPIVPTEGIKRPRVHFHLSGVSNAVDSMDSSDHTSTDLAQQAGRTQ